MVFSFSWLPLMEMRGAGDFRHGDVECEGGSAEQWCSAYPVNHGKRLWGFRPSTLCSAPILPDKGSFRPVSSKRQNLM